MTDANVSQLDAVILNIRKTSDQSGFWALEWRDLASQLQIPPARMLRSVETMRHRINASGKLGRFTHDAPEQLIEVLEDLWGDDARIEIAFQRAGLFLNYGDQVAIQQEILEGVNFRLNQADLNDDRMAHLFKRFNGRWPDVFDHLRSWLKAETWVTLIVDELVECSTSRPKAAYRVQMRLFVDRMITRNVLSVSELLGALHRQCQAWGDRWNQKDTSYAKAGDSDVDVAEALREMGLETWPSEDLLKKRYRKLMLEHHPDINPQGQDKTIRINRAYAVLLAHAHVD